MGGVGTDYFSGTGVRCRTGYKCGLEYKTPRKVTCVWASLVLELRLIELVYQGHSYTHRRRLPKQVASDDGLSRPTLPNDNYEEDIGEGEHEDTRRGYEKVSCIVVQHAWFLSVARGIPTYEVIGNCSVC